MEGSKIPQCSSTRRAIPFIREARELVSSETTRVHHAVRRHGSVAAPAYAQQPGKLRTIGFLGPNTHSAAGEWVAALQQRLRELGWMEGRTITIEYRWAEG